MSCAAGIACRSPAAWPPPGRAPSAAGWSADPASPVPFIMNSPGTPQRLAAPPMLVPPGNVRIRLVERRVDAARPRSGAWAQRWHPPGQQAVEGRRRRTPNPERAQVVLCQDDLAGVPAEPVLGSGERGDPAALEQRLEGARRLARRSRCSAMRIVGIVGKLEILLARRRISRSTASESSKFRAPPAASCRACRAAYRSGTGVRRAAGGHEASAGGRTDPPDPDPAMAASTSPQSSAVRASGPSLSIVQLSAIAPWRLTRPKVGRSPVTPQNAAGYWIEPHVSEPMANGTSPAADRRPRTARRSAGPAARIPRGLARAR